MGEEIAGTLRKEGLNMTTNAELIERIDLEKILPMPRYAGGHDEQMKALLKNSTVLAHWNEGDYQGKVATVVQLNDTKEIVIYEDYYGSCSSCDAWEDANDEDVKHMCKQLASSAQIFKDLEEAKNFLSLEGEYGKICDLTRKELLHIITGKKRDEK